MSRFRFVFAFLAALLAGGSAKELLIHRELATLQPPQYTKATLFLPGNMPETMLESPTPHIAEVPPGAL